MIYISSSNRKSSSEELRALLQFCIHSSKYVILTSYESKDEDFAESLKACGLAKHERRTDGSLVTTPAVCDLCWFDIHAVDLRVMEKDFYSAVQVGDMNLKILPSRTRRIVSGSAAVATNGSGTWN